jgi:hypothetical protein
VFDILSAYVRTSSHRPPSLSDGAPSSLQLRQPDVAAAITALARRTVVAGDPALDLRGSQLAGARLDRARLAGADLAGPTSAWPTSSRPIWPGRTWSRP